MEQCPSILIATDHKPLVEKLEDREVEQTGEFGAGDGPWFIRVGWQPQTRKNAAGFYADGWPPQNL